MILSRRAKMWTSVGVAAAVALQVPWLTSYSGGDVSVTVCGNEVVASSMNPVTAWGLMPATVVAVIPYGADNMEIVGYSLVDQNGNWGITKFSSVANFSQKLTDDSPGQWTGPSETRALLIAVQQVMPSAAKSQIDGFDVIFRGPLGLPYWQRLDGSISIIDSCAETG